MTSLAELYTHIEDLPSPFSSAADIAFFRKLILPLGKSHDKKSPYFILHLVLNGSDASDPILTEFWSAGASAGCFPFFKIHQTEEMYHL